MPTTNDQTPASGAFELVGADGSRLVVKICPVHPGAVELYLSDGRSPVAVELEGDDALRVADALTAAHLQVTL